MSNSGSIGAQLVLHCPANHLAGNIFRMSDGIVYEEAEGKGSEPWETFIDAQGNFIVECDDCDGHKVYDVAQDLEDELDAETGKSIRATRSLKYWSE